jgi:hypothetical protein
MTQLRTDDRSRPQLLLPAPRPPADEDPSPAAAPEGGDAFWYPGVRYALEHCPALRAVPRG